MKNSNKIFNKIKSVIYDQSGGFYTEEEAYQKIKEVMDIHNLNQQTNPKRSDFKDKISSAKELNEFPMVLSEVKTIDKKCQQGLDKEVGSIENPSSNKKSVYADNPIDISDKKLLKMKLKD